MSRVIDDELVEPVVRTLLGVIDVEGGPTDEQRSVLRALAQPTIDCASVPGPPTSITCS